MPAFQPRENRARFDELRQRVRALLPRAYVPYSGMPRAAAVLLSDGACAYGVRVENASHSLTIPAAASALAVTVSAGRRDVKAVVFSGRVHDYEAAYIGDLRLGPSLRQIAPDLFATDSDMPGIRHSVTSYAACEGPCTPHYALKHARLATRYAFAPNSDFPVGAVAVTPAGRLYAGINIEHPDWTRTLCAERAALAAAVSDGAREFVALAMTCARDARGTPCGACRQVMAELMPHGSVWIESSNGTRAVALQDLLPEAFALPDLPPPK